MGNKIPITADISLLHPDELGRWVGERLAEHRLSANLTREALGQRAGVSAEAIKVAETRGRSSLATLARLLTALGLQGRLQALFALEPAKSIAELERREAAPTRKRARRKIA
jgi:transcriptional regulator with XRE-family HTH domain